MPDLFVLIARALAEAWRRLAILGFAWAKREIAPDAVDRPFIEQRLAQLRSRGPFFGLSPNCCMHADCQDEHCPGRAMAREAAQHAGPEWRRE